MNYGFPLLWTGVIRPAYDVNGGTAPGIYGGDPQCATTRRRTAVTCSTTRSFKGS
ncbi:MAG: hypothetical protein M3124_00930 [Actinomycetota bacterium]|nr:hypothetical protein [Actinomycetota bacterium]